MKTLFAVGVAAMIAFPVYAQSTGGAVITVSGIADIKADNDQAIATFFVEEQDKDKAAAASRVNQKMKTGTEAIKQEDPQALLTTRGYYSYPVYADDASSSNSTQPRKRQLIGWRVGQSLEVKTENLQQLPATAAAAQKTLALNGLNFGLSDHATKKLEATRLEAGYKNFTERVAAIAKAMGRQASDATIETLNFDGNEGNFHPMMASPMMAKSAMRSSEVAEPSFEPGITELNVKVVGQVKFK